MSPGDERHIDIDQRSLRDQLIDSLRERIVSSKLPQGERLDLPQIARDYDVSPIPIREALIVLESEGVVTSKARRGVFVAQLSAEDLIEIYQVREAIEIQAVELLIAADDPVSDARLAAALAELDACWDREDHNFAVRADMRLHGLVAALSGNARLARLAQNMSNQTLIHLVPVEESHERLRGRPSDHFHADIVRNIRQRDVDSALIAIRDHYRWSRERLVEPTLGLWQGTPGNANHAHGNEPESS